MLEVAPKVASGHANNAKRKDTPWTPDAAQAQVKAAKAKAEKVKGGRPKVVLAIESEV